MRIKQKKANHTSDHLVTVASDESSRIPTSAGLVQKISENEIKSKYRSLYLYSMGVSSKVTFNVQ